MIQKIVRWWARDREVPNKIAKKISIESFTMIWWAGKTTIRAVIIVQIIETIWGADLAFYDFNLSIF